MKREGHPQSLVIGYDAGSHALEVTRAALDMRVRFGTALEFIHVIDMPLPGDLSGRPDLVAETEAEIGAKTFEHVVSSIEGVVEERHQFVVREHLAVRVGHPAREIVALARDIEADTIMIGPHMKRGLFDFGSTARAVLGSSPCDVWVQPGPHRDIKSLLVPTDLSEESLLALRSARDLAQEYGAKVTVVHCFLPPDVAYATSPGYPIAGPTYVVDDVRRIAREEFDSAMALFEWQGVEHEERFVEGRPAEVVLDLQGEFDLIAMGSHGRTGLAAAVLGNVAYSVLRQSEIPVLAMRHPKRSWLLG